MEEKKENLGSQAIEIDKRLLVRHSVSQSPSTKKSMQYLHQNEPESDEDDMIIEEEEINVGQ